MIDLGQIVVLGSQPEHRNAVHSSRRSLFGKLDRRERLEDREQRPAKKTNLLPSNRRQRSTPQTLNIRQRLSGGAPCPVLPLKNLAHLAASRIVINHALRFVLNPLRKNRRPWIKTVNRRIVGKIIKKKTCGMRNLRKRQTLRFHRQLPGHLSRHKSVLTIRICSHSLRRARGVFVTRVKNSPSSRLARQLNYIR